MTDTPLENARLAILADYLERRAHRSDDRDDLNRIWRAMMLAPDIDVCLALLHGETVPMSRLNFVWIRRLGLRNNGR
jgi:hypothetical protein